MANRSGRNYDGEKIEHWIQTMVPEVVLAVESLDIATPERIFSHLQEQNIKATKSETEMALEYGCRVGVMEERRRYRLNPELREVLSPSGSSKSRPKQSRESRESDLEDCTSLSFSENDIDSCSDRSSSTNEIRDNDSEDLDDDDDDDDDDVDNNNEFSDRDYVDQAD